LSEQQIPLRFLNPTLAARQALASTLAGTKMGPVVAVDRWIKRYPALVEMDQREKWFRPMMEGMARRLVDEVGWAAKRRL
jgi:hypothetical protein